MSGMAKNYFTDEQVFEILRKVNPRQLSVHHTILDDDELIYLINLTVETAIGEPVGQLSVDYQGFKAYKNITDLPEGYHKLHSAKGLEN